MLNPLKLQTYNQPLKFQLLQDPFGCLITIWELGCPAHNYDITARHIMWLLFADYHAGFEQSMENWWGRLQVTPVNHFFCFFSRGAHYGLRDPRDLVFYSTPCPPAVCRSCLLQHLCWPSSASQAHTNLFVLLSALRAPVAPVQFLLCSLLGTPTSSHSRDYNRNRDCQDCHH